MKTEISTQLTWQEFASRFDAEGEGLMKVLPEYGAGELWNYRVEKGLLVRKWNCLFKEPFLLVPPGADDSKRTFTIAYFPEAKGLKLYSSFATGADAGIWNMVFFCNNTAQSLEVPAGQNMQCFTINFSEYWIRSMLGDDCIDELLRSNICDGSSLYKISFIPLSDIELVTRVFNLDTSVVGDTLVLKSIAYSLVANFFESLRNRDLSNCQQVTVVERAKQYILERLGDKHLDLHQLAEFSGASLTTLKRKFRKQCGVSIHTFHMVQKLHYAQRLMDEKYSPGNVAKAVGYTDYNSFTSFFKRYSEIVSGEA